MSAQGGVARGVRRYLQSELASLAGGVGALAYQSDGQKGFYHHNGTAWNHTLRRILDPRDFGAVGDGTTHTLTSDDLAAHLEWLGTYEVGDEWDYVGIQEAIYAAWGAPVTQGGQVVCSHGLANSYLNGSVYIPGGRYRLNKTLFARNIIGATLEGQGRYSTILQGLIPDTPLLETNMVYSTIRGIKFDASAPLNGNALVEYTWNGSGLTTAAGLQQLTVYDCEFHGENQAGGVGFRIARDLVQGDNIAFINCFFAACTHAGCQTGDGAYNALNIGFYGCDFQSCPADGILIYGGNTVVVGGSFQSGGVGVQTGYDIRLVSSASSHSFISGCRSESIRFLYADSHHNVHVEGCSVLINISRWAANVTHALNNFVTGQANQDGKLYRCKTAGVSGIVEPVWDGSANVVDGTAVWQLEDYTVLQFDAGSVVDCTLPYGKVVLGPGAPVTIAGCIFSRDDWLYKNPATETILGSDASYISLLANTVWHGAGLNVGAATAFALPSVNAGAHPTAYLHYLLPGAMPLLWARRDPTTGTSARDVGFWPPHGCYPAGDNRDLSENVVGILGALGPRHAEAADTAGPDLILQGGLSRGNQPGGAIRLRVGAAGASGSDLNDPSGDRMLITSTRMNLSGLPIVDPHVVGDLWNSAGTLKVSAG